MEEYKDYTIAYLPAIEFLDYRLVDEESVKTQGHLSNCIFYYSVV